MSITDELRKYADDLDKKAAMKSEHGFSPIGMRLERIADNIDAEHESAMAEQFKSLTVDMKPMTDENMAEGGWVRLPVDADGETIHIGDVMDTEHFGTVEVEGFVHSAVAFYNYSGQPAYICTAPANMCRHHHEPTVEETLQKMLEQAVGYSDAHTTVAYDTIAEYAAKLRKAVRDA